MASSTKVKPEIQRRFLQIENELIKDDNIIMYYFDEVKHSYPINFKRWFLFTIKNFEEGMLIKNKIQNDIINKFL